jgi:hypothetical protein
MPGRLAQVELEAANVQRANPENLGVIERAGASEI